MSPLCARLEIALALIAAALLTAGTAPANQDRFMIGDSIHVGPGESLDHATCVACSIRVDGVVKEDAFLVLGRLVNHGTIEGDAVVVGGSLESEGPIQGDSVVVAGNMKLGDDVQGSAVSVMGDIEATGPGVKIGGDVVTVLGRPSGLSADAVGGNIERFGSDRIGHIVLSGAIAAFVVLVFVVFAVLLTLNGIAFLILGRQRLETMANTLAGNSPFCFLVGLATCFALGIVGLIVAMLLPVSLPIFLLFVVVSVVGFAGMTYGIGGNLFGSLQPLPATLAAGAVVIFVQLIPVIGWLVTVVLWNVAIGAAVLSGFGTATDWLASRADGSSLHGQQAS